MLSICIPAYHCNVDVLLRSLQKQLESLSDNVEILVCDDCSPSPVISNPHEFPELRVIRNSTNLGRASTRNVLVQASKGQALLFLDGDSEVISSNFVSDWLGIAQNPSIAVCYGGSVYQSEPPPPSHFLRWKVSTIRESKTLGERNKDGGGFKTNNVLIRRCVFNKISFDEQLSGYGHEDTLFGFELLVKGYTVHQIDNPVRNALLDTNEAYLAKTEEAIQNLVECIQLSSNREAFIAHVRLLRIYAKIQMLQLHRLLRAIAFFGLPLLRKRLLTGRGVGLVYWFDCFKLVMLDRTLKDHHIKV